MSDKFCLLSTVALLALVTATPAAAQDTAPTPAPQDVAAPDQSDASAGDIIVTGLRATLANAANIKRDSAQIQDSIVAEDIGKLPDTNIAELLQRVPGVQIARNTRGEGNGYVVHGLKQVMTTVNGRQLFSTTNRTASLLDFSADMLSGVDVYKAATADQIEGGLGGLINVHMARPFDFSGLHVAATATAQYSDFADKGAPRLSGVISDRFQTGAGEIGILFGGQFERFYSGGYQNSTNAYANSTSLYDRDGDGQFNTTPADTGDTVQLPGQVRPRYEIGNRVRATYYGALQWAPSQNLTIYADAMHSYSGGHSYTSQLSVQTDAATRIDPTSITYKAGPNGNIPDTYTLTNAVVRSVTGASDNPYNTLSIGGGFDWHNGRLSVSGEAAYVDSSGPFYSRSISIQTRAPSATVNLSGTTPTVSISGVDLNSPASYTGPVSYSDLGQQSSGSEPSFRLDAGYKLDGPITAIKVGARYARHRAINDVYSISQTVTLAQPLAAVTTLTPNDLFTDQSVPVNQWLMIQNPYIYDQNRTRVLSGISINDPTYPLTNHYNYLENVWAVYGEADFAFKLGVPIDGNVGLRYVSTKNHQSVYNASLQPVEGEASYDNWLPSANVRVKFTPNLFLRLAYSKAITRPDFGNLSPALVLNVPTLTGSGGNPDLQPTKANQYDASLEWYFGKSNYAAIAVFQKDVTGFVQKFSVSETINGDVYSISRPRNTGAGTIKGFELTYQQFLDFLPGFLNGLGIQGNYTYVDSALPVVGQSVTVPADLLSKYSYNITGIYEKGPISLHVSYNWRSKSVQTNFADNFGRTLWNAPQNSLDFSLTYNLNKNVSVKFDAVNLSSAYQIQYYGTPDIPTLSNQLDRSYQLGVHVNF